MAAPAPASPATRGGAVAPSATGGASYETRADTERRPAADALGRRRAAARRRRARARVVAQRRRPVLVLFSLGRARLTPSGLPTPVAFRIRARTRYVSVWLNVTPPSASAPAATIALGRRRAGATHLYALTGREAGPLAAGRYGVQIAARDGLGRPLRRGATLPLSVESPAPPLHRFPLLGPFSYGGSASRFGAPRSGHRHAGQDLSAPEGTPVVAPRAGTVETVRYQAGGAGHYVVLDGDGEDHDYVFMHLRSGSIRVRAGQRVGTGEQLAEVGSTGRSSGPHLHFEIWVGGWYAGGHPIDPLPLLQAWDAVS